MKMLLVHQGFPAQYAHIARHMASVGGHSVASLSQLTPRSMTEIPGVEHHRYPLLRKPLLSGNEHFQDQEAKFIRGESAARMCEQLKRGGYTPDVICAHPGWGEALFLRDVFPDTPIVLYLEFYYRAEGLDVGFDPEFANVGGDPLSLAARIRMKNYHILSSMESMTCGVSPTKFQAGTFPEAHSGKISVIFDGVDTGRVAPDPAASFEIPGKRKVVRRGDKVVTFVNRSLEPYRGYHQFMRSLPVILERVPEAEVLIIGGDDVSYSPRPTDGVSYKKRFFDEVSGRLDTTRVHFLGRVPYERYLRALQVSAAHVYLTYPFVLGWSMVEAMSVGCTIIGSDTPTVTEVLRDGENGIIVPFFEPERLAAAVVGALERPREHAGLGAAARRDVLEMYDLHRVCLPRQMRLLRDLTGGQK